MIPEQPERQRLEEDPKRRLLVEHRVDGGPERGGPEGAGAGGKVAGEHRVGDAIDEHARLGDPRQDQRNADGRRERAVLARACKC